MLAPVSAKCEGSCRKSGLDSRGYVQSVLPAFITFCRRPLPRRSELKIRHEALLKAIKGACKGAPDHTVLFGTREALLSGPASASGCGLVERCHGLTGPKWLPMCQTMTSSDVCALSKRMPVATTLY